MATPETPGLAPTAADAADLIPIAALLPAVDASELGYEAADPSCMAAWRDEMAARPAVQ
jgi:hypothetical protein